MYKPCPSVPVLCHFMWRVCLERACAAATPQLRYRPPRTRHRHKPARACSFGLDPTRRLVPRKSWVSFSFDWVKARGGHQRGLSMSRRASEDSDDSNTYIPTENAWLGGTVESLTAWLLKHGVNPEDNPEVKTLSELATEVDRGETTLDVKDDGTAVRRVKVLRLLIRNDANKILIEAKQVWSDGRVRFRGTPLSEKMIANEEILVAATRAVEEELGSCLKPWYELFLDESSIAHTKTGYGKSNSYPGLRSQYHFVTMDARVTGLPKAVAPETDENEINSQKLSRSTKALLREPCFTSTEDLGDDKTLTATWVWRVETAQTEVY